MVYILKFKNDDYYLVDVNNVKGSVKGYSRGGSDDLCKLTEQRVKIEHKFKTIEKFIDFHKFDVIWKKEFKTFNDYRHWLNNRYELSPELFI